MKDLDCNMAHLGNYGGKTPTKKQKAKAIAMHQMPSGMMMSDKEMEGMRKKSMRAMKKYKK